MDLTQKKQSGACAETLRIVLLSAGALTLLQLARFALKQAAFLFMERTIAADTAVSAIIVLLLIPAVIFAGKRLGLRAHVWPERKRKLYWLALGVFLLLLGSGPLLTRDVSARALLTLLYGTVLTPVYEELIFRGYLWEALSRRFAREWQVYAVTTVLFALWHLGYADTVLWRAAQHGAAAGIATILFWKVVVGFCFGVAAGFARWRCKNALAGMLLHGAMNVFGR